MVEKAIDALRRRFKTLDEVPVEELARLVADELRGDDFLVECRGALGWVPRYMPELSPPEMYGIFGAIVVELLKRREN